MTKELELPGLAGKRRLKVTHMHPAELKPGTHTYEVFVDGKEGGIGGSSITSGYTGRRETVAVLTLTTDMYGTITDVKANSAKAADLQRRILRDQHGRKDYP